MALFRLNIEWSDSSNNTLVYKYPFKKSGKEVNNKSTLTVRESQCAVFVYKGQIADVFGPGLYDLKTDIFPILTKLASWKYAFETPITLDVYYVNTKQFTDVKWGTQNPIMMRDPEFGVIRVRGFGSFAFKVDDPTVFMKELFGTDSTFKTQDIVSYLKTMLVSALTDVLGESKISALDLAGNTLEFNEIVKRSIQQKFNEIGLKLTNLFIENMSVPSEVEKALDERTKLGILGDKTDVLMKVSAAEAMKSAAKNEGNAMAGAGVSMGAGLGMGKIFADAFSQNTTAQNTANTNATKTCSNCGKNIPKSSKFCPECGQKLNVKNFCEECGEEVPSSAKFCPSCGNKLK